MGSNRSTRFSISLPAPLPLTRCIRAIPKNPGRIYGLARDPSRDHGDKKSSPIGKHLSCRAITSKGYFNLSPYSRVNGKIYAAYYTISIKSSVKQSAKIRAGRRLIKNCYSLLNLNNKHSSLILIRRRCEFLFPRACAKIIFSMSVDHEHNS